MGVTTSKSQSNPLPVQSNTTNVERSPQATVAKMDSKHNIETTNKTSEHQHTTGPKYYNIEDIVNSDMDTMVDMTDREVASITIHPKIGRKIAVVRHAETMNEAFPKWYSLCVSQDHYSAKDLNHPFKLPLRSRGFSLYNVDPPLTQLAKHASKILGKALAHEMDITWETVISAPELAAVQTASKIAFSATSDKTYILIDESLCDPDHRKMDFMTPMELMKLDVAATVSQSYKSKDSAESTATRVLTDIDRVQRSHKGNLIIVVGPSSFNAIMRQLLCGDLKEQKESNIPHLACVILESEPRSWKLYKKQVLPLRNNDSASSTFDLSFYLPK